MKMFLQKLTHKEKLPHKESWLLAQKKISNIVWARHEKMVKSGVCNDNKKVWHHGMCKKKVGVEGEQVRRC